MQYVSSFVPNIENSSNFDSFDYLFGCQCSEGSTICSLEDSNECPITTQ
ncbi:MAG: hypothetical protein AB1782_03610 [Cyanobacteriota bacterium]